MDNPLLRMRTLLLVFCLLPTLFIHAQSVITGRVLDSRSQEPLAFVSVLVVGEREGTTTDIDGKFSLRVAQTTGPSSPQLRGLYRAGGRCRRASTHHHPHWWNPWRS
jgi:hypothetical protein